VEASQKLAARVAAIRAGNWQGAQKKQKARRPWFKLTPTGPVATAVVWKNLIGAGQVVSIRLWITVIVVVAVFIGVFAGKAPGKGFPIVMEILIAAALGYSLLLGPQLLRLDFRNDLPMADLLKTLPMHGWRIALGEILAPAAVLAMLQWLLLLLGLGLLLFLPVKQDALILAIALGAAILLPVLDMLLLLIPNAAVLLFPSWIQTGKDSPRGVEATGQRLIFALGQMLALMLALLPAAAAFVGVFFLFNFMIGPDVAVSLASLAATMILGAEAGLGVMLLGKLFDRFDVTEEPAG
jgi:hypothetical protein